MPSMRVCAVECQPVESVALPPPAVEPPAPPTWNQAMHESSTQWHAVADAEYAMLVQLGTWTKMPLHPGRVPIQTKWVFKRKFADGGFNL